MKFHIVDVFAERKYSGNQLAVFICDGALPGEEMQRIAREINFSESAFVLSKKEEPGGWPVRIFTPAHEVDFAGHPSLGAAHIIRRERLGVPASTVRLQLRVGTIPVEFSPTEGEPLWMQQIDPRFGNSLPGNRLADALGLPPTAIDRRFPVQEVSTGLPHILVPLVTLDFLRQARADPVRYANLVEKSWAKCIMVFCLQGRSSSHDISVRMFAPYLGVPEDPATGSGNGCLAGYLVKHNCLDSRSISVTVGQGHEIGRPSLLFLKAAAEKESIRIRVGGRVVEIAAGTWDA
jgi:trans-2,3-dihydro-3-hydroxyanthranilate isomerase